MRILVVEDEPKVAEALKAGLEAERFEVVLAPTGEEGLWLAGCRPFDVVLLDLLLPGRGGLEVLAALRGNGHRVPVLVLTARDAVADRVLGLEAGADDYIVKPFAFAELLARIRAVLRRGLAERVLELTAADLTLDVVGRQVARAGRPIHLTAKEFDLLEFLLRHQGDIVSRAMLAREVWQQTMRATPLDNVIDVHIARLRKKVDEPYAVKLIHTVRGMGYRLREEGP